MGEGDGGLDICSVGIVPQQPRPGSGVAGGRQRSSGIVEPDAAPSSQRSTKRVTRTSCEGG